MVFGISDVYIYGIPGHAQLSVRHKTVMTGSDGVDKQVNQLQGCGRIRGPSGLAVGR